MEKRTYTVLLIAVLVTILAVPSISTADRPPERIMEGFLLGETGCQMNVQMERDGSGIIGANVGPANRNSPPCQDDCESLNCPPSPCCFWESDGCGGSWNCSLGESEGEYLCTSCTYFDVELGWVTPVTCPPVPGPGGGTLPTTCNLDSHTDIHPIDRFVICEGCTGPPDEYGDYRFYNCSAAICEPFTAVERNIMEKLGDNSKWCYSSAGYSVCSR